jgi:hypothetical protein
VVSVVRAVQTLFTNRTRLPHVTGGQYDGKRLIVAKRRDRHYRSGRSPDWIKVKNPDAPAVTRLIEG